MPIKRPQLIDNEIYHIVTRGVGDAVVFKNIDDYYRGIFSLYEFNTIRPVVIRERRKARLYAKKIKKEQISDTREPLVEILAFAFMPNHTHLLLRQVKHNGITNFMRKVGAGYAAYFNKKYDRKGHLFQGRFRAVHVKTNQQLQNVFIYIHANPLSLIEPKWREIGISNPGKAIKFLKEEYRWSSYQDYIGRKNFPSVTVRDFLSAAIGGEKACGKFIDGWIKYKGEFKNFHAVELE
ncbi:MAG: hypothetical protein A2667_00010 [Candidatus Wildermuthbacteria bacterium RIFCSPHIGHO2_01_FULL_47_27]|uniref:Transposase IS200-like domain-containing protein n=2 Tax=Candidatus Wildermuthiibacteriota TaxID=1817923 RepID=A0A1G2RQM9_9BACT|nr:MAG: hypothetical protein UY15_C0009G0022 [Parcubacteria group bacterium GW2011_GWA2_47_9]OHA64451.1 MAG: hypothetical protein A2667_00010 [Candidatus Wildermuthbacteria bacterium RIFCSPHIGHO2_01_FULL_47_27]OHA66865.1 MAG: hypothetical protein A3D59_04155 [Candidatus Wildermuthbacteria bacterium RIFCSPHIGHO2_02_FULL_47_17]OHA74572.1 MAG: hypothetical protein A3A32_02745 [Candidatus Wildermuthbacteria bacterium RIFCSPLOWO2_01_FULL_48_35]OHA75841.1 MAG: hypothetical protein A3I38_00375 [Candid